MNAQDAQNANRETKLDLQIQLVHELRQNDKRLNLLFIGTSGVGKSSVINSIATAVTPDKFREYAISGADPGEARQATHRLQIIKGERYGRFNREIFGRANLPNLIDIAGFQDEDTAYNEELIRVVLYGRFESGDSFVRAQRYLRENGVAAFRNRYRNIEVDENKIDRVIVVASATEPVPRALIECIQRAAGNTDARAGNRSIPVFGVMTKIDQTDLHTVEFKQHEMRYLNALQMTGSRQRYKRVSSYCDDTDPRYERLTQCIERLDIPFLEFLIQVCSSSYEVLHDEETFQAVPGYQLSRTWLAFGVLLIFIFMISFLYDLRRR